jgi:hypothetical protein
MSERKGTFNAPGRTTMRKFASEDGNTCVVFQVWKQVCERRGINIGGGERYKAIKLAVQTDSSCVPGQRQLLDG